MRTTRWEPTGALVRAAVVGAAGLVWAVVAGEPALLVLTSPLLVSVLPAVLRRPRSAPVLDGPLDRASVHEGQATVLGLVLTEDGAGGPGSTGSTGGVEQVTRVVSAAPFTRATPAQGHVSVLREDLAATTVEVGARRWGTRTLGEQRVALLSAWGGFRWGPEVVPGRVVRVLPSTAYDSRAESPHPRGLVGAHRSDRPGQGTELAGIRAFQAGDRLRRINWRVSVRTGALHVTTTRAEQDAGLLLVIDLYAEHGTSQGVDGAASSLDLTVRAAAALAEHAVRTGDRVALRPIGGRSRAVPPGAGRRHLRRVLGTLADVRTGSAPYDDVARLDLRVGAGTTVVILTPLLVDAVATTAAGLVRRGLPTVVVDTLPADVRPAPGDSDATLVDVAWRMRQLERAEVRTALDALGCPVVAWRGAGTVDEVLRRLARRRPGSGAAR